MTRKGLYSKQLIPFPKKLMNTALSSNAMGLEYARNITNMIPSQSKAGSGQKRFGLVELGTAIGNGVITHLMEYVKDDGSIQILAYTNDGKIHLTEDYGTTWEVVHSGLNTSGTVRSATLQRKLVVVNGFNENMYWDGSTFHNMSESVIEKLPKTWVDENTFTVLSPDDISTRHEAGKALSFTFSAKNIEIDTISRTGTTATITCVENVNVRVGDSITLFGISDSGYEATYTVTGVTAADSPSYNNDYGNDYDNTTLGGTSDKAFTITVDSSLAAAPTARTARIKMVKGESIPTLDWEFYSSVGTDQSNWATIIPVNIQSMPERCSAIRGTMRKVAGGDPDYVNCTVYYRAKGDTDWIEGTTYNGIGTRVYKNFEFHFPSYGWWEIKLESSSSIKGLELRATNNGAIGAELLIAKEFTVSSLGNRLLKDNIVEISSITRSGNTATVTTTVGHGLSVGDAVTVFDAAQDDYNITGIVLTAASATTFTYAVANDPTTPATVNPDLLTVMNMSINGATRTTSIASSSFSTDTLTINLDDAIFPNDGEVDIKHMVYTDKPPPFSFIYSKHDRLWALSSGELLATQYRENGDEDRLTIYYTSERDVLNSWIDDETQAVSFIDTKNKHNIEDEFVGISSISGSMVFHGRKRLQIWTGTNPTIDGDFSWAKTVPISTVHGSLIQEIPNDVLFLSDYGFRTLSVAFQTEELEIGANIGEDVDPTAESIARTIKADDNAYKLATSFGYQQGGMYGFKAGGVCIVYIITEKAKGWVFFTKAFVDSSSFLSLSDGRLLAAKNDKMLRYANGVLGATKQYADDSEAYTTIWFTPWIESNRRWFNQYWEFVTDNNEDTASFNAVLYRYKDNDPSTQTPYNITLGQELSLWDDAQWDVGLWDSAATRVKQRDQFKAESYAFALISNNTIGGLDIIAVQALGA